MMTQQLAFYIFYLSSYSLISYYSICAINNYGFSNNIYQIVNPFDYYPLVLTTCLFLSSDLVYKYYYHSRNAMYYALFLHHVVSLLGYYLTLHYGLAQTVICNLSLFELSSIPLLFYSERILVEITLPLTWIVFFAVRIIWGNWIILDSLNQLKLVQFPVVVKLVIYGCHGFFLIANNYWFFKLTRRLSYRRSPIIAN